MRKSSLSVVLGLLAVLLPAGAAQAQNMAVAGQFAVSPSGAAIYTIPITVPPGVAGMQPQLALSYNSQAGNGPVGMGWGLSGMSAITRCPRTMAQDGARGGVNYDANDRFCLDGQRLIVVSGNYGEAGSEYRTEVEGYSRITYDGQGFVVQSKAGLSSEYGKTEDSRIEAQGKSVVRLWALSRVSDVVNNCMAYSYQEDNGNGDFRLRFIDYAGTVSGASCVGGNNRVELVYQARTDVVSKYRAGSVMRSTQRLSSIKASTSGQEVRQYRLRYAQASGGADKSRLLGVQECAFVSSCLKEKVLTYKDSAKTPMVLDAAYTNSLPSSHSFLSKDTWLVDVNGDGLKDLIKTNPLYDTGGQNDEGWFGHIYINNGEKFIYEEAYSKSLVKSFDEAQKYKPTYATYASKMMGPKLEDINSDGLLDVVFIVAEVIQVYEGDYHLTNNRMALILINTGAGFVFSYYPINGIISGDGIGFYRGDSSDHGVRFLDVDGDGLADLVQLFYSNKNSSPQRKVFLNKNQTFVYDEKYSLSIPNLYISSLVETPYRHIMKSTTWVDTGTKFADVNGDGLPDLIQLFFSNNHAAYGGVPQRRVYLNDGQTFVFDEMYTNSLPDAYFSGYVPENGLSVDMGTRLEDINRDGLPDLIQLFFPSGRYYPGAGFYGNIPQKRVFLNTGRSFVYDQSYSNSLSDTYFSGFEPYYSSFDMGTRLFDINNDGFPDLIQLFQPHNGWYGNRPQKRVFLNTGSNFVFDENMSKNFPDLYFLSVMDGFQEVGGCCHVPVISAMPSSIRLEDINGDGVPDVVQSYQDASNWTQNKKAVYLGTGSVSDGLLASVDDGTGNVTTINYLGKHVYEKTPAVTAYPLLRVPGPLNRVTEHSKSDGAGGMSKFSYAFRNLGVEVGTGRGWQGFKSMTVKEEATGIERYTEYRQGWPFTGMAELAETRLAGAGSAGVLKRTQTTYACQTGAGAACQAVPINCNLASNVVACNAISRGRVMPYAAKVSEQGWDLNGAALPSSTTDTTFNDWGDVSTMVVQSSAGGGTSTKRVNNEYHPVNTGNGKWIVGRLKKATVTSTVTTP